MISGHRSMHAATLAGLEAIPAFIRELSDDDATIIMVDANLQREELLPSEKAFAYKMKYDAMRHQGARSDLKTSAHNGRKLEAATLSQNGTKLEREVTSPQNGTKLNASKKLSQNETHLRSDEMLAEQVGESKNQVL